MLWAKLWSIFMVISLELDRVYTKVLSESDSSLTVQLINAGFDDLHLTPLWLIRFVLGWRESEVVVVPTFVERKIKWQTV